MRRRVRRMVIEEMTLASDDLEREVNEQVSGRSCAEGHRECHRTNCSIFRFFCSEDARKPLATRSGNASDIGDSDLDLFGHRVEAWLDEHHEERPNHRTDKLGPASSKARSHARGNVR